MNESRFQTTLIFITLSTALLYFEGLVYYQAYLGGFGINSSLSSLTTEELMSYGFIELAGLSLLSQLWIIIVASIVIPLIYAFVLVPISPSKLLKPAILGMKKYSHLLLIKNAAEKLKSSDLIAYVEKIFIKVISFFPALLLFFLITLVVSERGRSYAEKEMNSFSENKKLVTLFTTISATPTKALLITCNESFCSFWLGDKSLTVRHEYIKQMVVVPTSKS